MNISYLGHVVSSEGIKFKHKKIEEVKNMTRPFSTLDIHSFLCLSSYYRRFLEGFFSISWPLTTLTQKNVKFVCLEACVESYQ